MGTTKASLLQRRQGPLREHYVAVPADALIHDGAQTLNSCAGDPFHGRVVHDHGCATPLPFGVHRAVGGDHDLPNPGDLLCAALAACLDTTLRMLADHLGIGLQSLQVRVQAECDVRGCLHVQRGVPVGFQRLHCSVQLQPMGAVAEDKLQMLLAAAEGSCVVLQTLRSGVTVQTEFAALDAAPAQVPAPAH